MARIRTEDDGDPSDDTEHVGDSPPRVIGEPPLNIGEDGCDKCDQPRQLIRKQSNQHGVS